MKVEKSLNNSLVLSTDLDGNEVILMGKGLGFRLKIGDDIPDKLIEKTFTLDSLSQSLKNDYINLFQGTSEELLQCVKQIINYANMHFDFQLSKNLFFTLVDHLHYAIERTQKQIVFQNKLLPEIQKFYPKEFSVGSYAIQLLNDHLGTSLPDEEAGNIAFHIVNAQSENDMEETVRSIRVLKDILMLLGYLFQEEVVDKESLVYLRFVTHLQFFINRMIRHESLPIQNEFLLDSVKERYTKEYQAALKIKAYVEDELDAVVNVDEVLFLTLHISRIYSK